ncbi:MAG: hypothetical protein ACFFCW_29150 [Candidatus Hodarchaeota archaeon]
MLQGKGWLWLLVFFILVSFAQLTMGEEAETPQEVIPAILLDQEAKIDGKLDDAVWQPDPKGKYQVYHAFRYLIDSKLLNDSPFRKRGEWTEVWVYYTTEALYVAFRCKDNEIIWQHDQPDQNVEDVGRGADDTVGYALCVDVDMHYNEDAHYWVVLNPKNTFFFRPAVGRASKGEFEGKLVTATQIYEEQGIWTAEVKLFWDAVDYPYNDGKPYDMLLLPQRRHKFPDQNARLAHFAQTYNGPDTRLNFCRFKGFKPPLKGIEQKLASYTYAGWREATLDQEGGFERQLGLDYRFRWGSNKNAFLTINPDFANPEQYVARINPIYGPRMLSDYRYFFQEGSQMLKLPYNFYSRRIEDIDVGASAYGELFDISLVTLATMYRGGDHNLVMRGYKDWGGNHWGGAYLGHRETGNHVFWMDLSRTGSWYSLTGDVAQNNPGSARKYWGQFVWKRPNFFWELQGIRIDEDYDDALGFHPFKGIQGLQSSFRKEISLQDGKIYYNFWGQAELKNYISGAIHRRTFDTYLWHRRGKHGYYISFWGGRYDENRDLLCCLMHWRNYGNQERFLKVGTVFGKQQGEMLFELGPSFAYRYKKLRTNWTMQFVQNGEFRYQLIVNLNYELTKKLRLGSRAVLNKDGTNIYFALHQTAYEGAEFFIIVGDPNAPEFRKRIVGKIIYVF